MEHWRSLLRGLAGGLHSLLFVRGSWPALRSALVSFAAQDHHSIVRSALHLQLLKSLPPAPAAEGTPEARAAKLLGGSGNGAQGPGGGGKKAAAAAEPLPWCPGKQMVCSEFGISLASMPSPEAAMFIEQAAIAVRTGVARGARCAALCGDCTCCLGLSPLAPPSPDNRSPRTFFAFPCPPRRFKARPTRCASTAAASAAACAASWRTGATSSTTGSMQVGLCNTGTCLHRCMPAPSWCCCHRLSTTSTCAHAAPAYASPAAASACHPTSLLHVCCPCRSDGPHAAVAGPGGLALAWRSGGHAAGAGAQQRAHRPAAEARRWCRNGLVCRWCWDACSPADACTARLDRPTIVSPCLPRALGPALWPASACRAPFGQPINQPLPAVHPRPCAGPRRHLGRARGRCLRAAPLPAGVPPGAVHSLRVPAAVLVSQWCTAQLLRACQGAP